MGLVNVCVKYHGAMYKKQKINISALKYCSNECALWNQSSMQLKMNLWKHTWLYEKGIKIKPKYYYSGLLTHCEQG